MIRLIKFRGKSLNTGLWVYGDLQQKGKKVFVEYEVNPENVGQFTGLCDKNGNEIYEGDILGTDDMIIGWVKGGVRGYCYDVIYINHPSREERWTLYSTVVDDYKGRVKVIGNIYDNKELLANHQ